MSSLYRWDAGSLEEAATSVGDALDLKLVLHDSSFYGGDYFRGERGMGQVIALVNFLEDDCEPFFQRNPPA